MPTQNTHDIVEAAMRRASEARTLPAGSPRAHTLVRDRNSYVRGQLAANPNLTVEVQQLLACDDCRQVRAVLAHNPNTVPEVLEYLVRTDFDKDVVTLANRNLSDGTHRESGADRLRTVA